MLGLEAALAEANDTNVLRGVSFSLAFYDDGYDVANISRNVYAPPTLAFSRRGKNPTSRFLATGASSFGKFGWLMRSR